MQGNLYRRYKVGTSNVEHVGGRYMYLTVDGRVRYQLCYRYSGSECAIPRCRYRFIGYLGLPNAIIV